MVKNILRVILIACGVGLVCLLGWIIMIIYAFGGFDKDYSVVELKQHFDAKKTEIYEVKDYINKIVPQNKKVEIEFENDNTLKIFHIIKNGKHETHWDVGVKSNNAIALLEKLGWTTETLKTLKTKLDKANCISVASGEPCNIGFQRSGMGKYYYNIFEKPIADSLKKRYNDSCTYIMVNDKLVLEYGGGAIGGQCFYNFK